MHWGEGEVSEREVMADWMVGNWEGEEGDLETVRQFGGAVRREAEETRGVRRGRGRGSFIVVWLVGVEMGGRLRLDSLRKFLRKQADLWFVSGSKGGYGYVWDLDA